MWKSIMNLAAYICVVCLVLSLSASPAPATVAGDISAGLPLTQVIANGLGAGLSMETILDQACAAGADHEQLFKAAVAQGADLTKLFKYILDKAATDPKLKDTCTICNLMKWAKEAGKDLVEIANAMMAAGADLTKVRECLASLGYPGADTYTYSPPGAPETPGVGPTFPGGGGGGGVASTSS
jgi:hypothetical protein